MSIDTEVYEIKTRNKQEYDERLENVLEFAKEYGDTYRLSESTDDGYYAKVEIEYEIADVTLENLFT